MLHALSDFFRQLRADVRNVVRSRYTYIILGLLGYVVLLQTVYLAAGWSFNRGIAGQTNLHCIAPSNAKILTAMFGSMLFAVFAIRGFGEAVHAMDLHYRKIMNVEFRAARKSAAIFLGLSGGLGLFLAWEVATIC